VIFVAAQINLEEWQFFLRGGTVLDRSQQPNNPSPMWISEEAWDNITVSVCSLPAGVPACVRLCALALQVPCKLVRRCGTTSRQIHRRDARINIRHHLSFLRRTICLLVRACVHAAIGGMHLCMCSHPCTCACIRVHVIVCECMCMYVCMCMRLHVHACVRVHACVNVPPAKGGWKKAE